MLKRPWGERVPEAEITYRLIAVQPRSIGRIVRDREDQFVGPDVDSNLLVWEAFSPKRRDRTEPSVHDHSLGISVHNLRVSDHEGAVRTCDLSGRLDRVVQYSVHANRHNLVAGAGEWALGV